MEESIYRQRQTVQRLFGPSATITGRMGSGVAPGVVEIHMGDTRLSCGRTFQQALGIATRRASTLSEAPAK
jgi:hypothetical protein